MRLEDFGLSSNDNRTTTTATTTAFLFVREKRERSRTSLKRRERRSISPLFPCSLLKLLPRSESNPKKRRKERRKQKNVPLPVPPPSPPSSRTLSCNHHSSRAFVVIVIVIVIIVLVESAGPQGGKRKEGSKRKRTRKRKQRRTRSEELATAARGRATRAIRWLRDAGSLVSVASLDLAPCSSTFLRRPSSFPSPLPPPDRFSLPRLLTRLPPPSPLPLQPDHEPPPAEASAAF